MQQLLEELSQKGIRVSAKGDLLSVNAPKGALTKELKDLLKAHKSELLILLNKYSQGINLYSELFLDSAISPANKFVEQNQEVKSVLLTGATGFLGAFILEELLQKDDTNIYCLVRANSDEEANKKIKNNLTNYQIWDDKFNSRIISVAGDLSKARLGLAEDKFDYLAEQIDIIYHSGALLNWVYSYAALKPVNVLGTHEILRLACRHRVKPVHYISTLAVLGADEYAGKVISETEPLAHWSGIELGYVQSKWVAEKLVLQARDRGLPVSIYRSPLISGHSKTGAWNTNDVICRIIKGCIQIESMAKLDYPLDLSPVDYVARAIVYLSGQPESIGQVFHLNNLQPLPWLDFVNWMQNFGYKIRLTSYKDWLESLSKISHTEENPLSPLLPFWSRRSLQGDLLIPSQFSYQKLPEISCQKTVSLLLPNKIVCPPLNGDLLNKYFQYFIDTMFLNPP